MIFKAESRIDTTKLEGNDGLSLFVHYRGGHIKVTFDPISSIGLADNLRIKVEPDMTATFRKIAEEAMKYKLAVVIE